MYSFGRHFRITSIIIIINSYALIQCNPLRLTPTSIEASVGSSFNVSCVISEEAYKSGCTPDRVFYKLNSKQVNQVKKYITSPTTIIYAWKNATLDYSGYYEFFCNLPIHDIPSILAGYFIEIGTKPQRLEDFQCINYDFYNRTCTFTKPSTALKATKYNLSYISGKYYRREVECTAELHNASRMSCSSFTDKFAQILFFDIHMWNNLGELNQSLGMVYACLHVKFAPFGHDIEIIKQTNGRSVKFQWSTPRYSNYLLCNGLVWDVLVKNWNITWSISQKSTTTYLTVSGLPYAYYTYELQIRKRINDEHTEWSDALIHHFRTEMAAPRRPPRVTHGSYYVNGNQLHFYWEQLKREEFNDDNLTYIISKLFKDDIAKDPNQIEVKSNYATIHNWNRRSTYSVYLKSKNSIGTSLEASLIEIPNLEKYEDRIPTNVEFDGYNQTLQWQAPNESADLLGYTVYWCEVLLVKTPNCNGSVFFQNVDRDTHYFAMQDVPHREETQIIMAVSASFGNTPSGGMVWSNWHTDKIKPVVSIVHNIEGLVALIVLALLGYLACSCYRKYHEMSNIQCEFPEGVELGIFEAGVLIKSDTFEQHKLTLVDPSPTLTSHYTPTTTYDVHLYEELDDYTDEKNKSSGYIAMETVCPTNKDTMITATAPKTSEYLPMECVMKTNVY